MDRGWHYQRLRLYRPHSRSAKRHSHSRLRIDACQGYLLNSILLELARETSAQSWDRDKTAAGARSSAFSCGGKDLGALGIGPLWRLSRQPGKICKQLRAARNGARLGSLGRRRTLQARPGAAAQVPLQALLPVTAEGDGGPVSTRRQRAAGSAEVQQLTRQRDLPRSAGHCAPHTTDMLLLLLHPYGKLGCSHAGRQC